MEERLAEAARLREEGQLEASRDLLLALAAEHPNDPRVNYQAAWAHDRLGLEREAVPFYERAIALGLTGEDLAGALLGLGSTLRALGDYPAAVRTLRRAVDEFPDRPAMSVFLAMALHNSGEHAEATERLLRVVAETSADPSIRRYRRAIGFYADDIDRVWES